LFTPRELIQALKGFYEDRKELQKFATILTCLIVNSSGFLKEPVNPDDLFRKSREASEIEAEENKEFLRASAERFRRK